MDPDFCSEDHGYERIVSSPTHFNCKIFKDLVTQEHADTIQREINLNKNYHGTIVYSTEDGRLLIAENMSFDKI